MPTWLVLIHQIPPKPDYLRVKVRRRLQQFGAIALKNSVYVLPKTDEALEDFQWLRQEILADGGEAMLIEGALLEGTSDETLEARFHAERNEEYATITESLVNATSAMEVQRMKRQLAEVVRRDHFDASGRQDAEAALREWERRAANHGATPLAGPQTPRPVAATWITRKGIKVDRIASAWLIKRWIDQAARFKFVEPTGYEPQPNELRFDMYEGEFTHEGNRCTFETLLVRFAMDDAALQIIAEIVHDIDCKDHKYQRPERDGIAMVIEGIIHSHSDDAARLNAGVALLDGLYLTFKGRAN